MIPDLLLALMGVPGDVFTLHTDENGDESLVVAKDVDFIKIHERARLDALVEIGGAYRALDRLARSETTRAHFSDAPSSPYRRALAIAIVERLGAYEAMILNLEQDALRRGGAAGTLNAIESALSDERVVLPSMCEEYARVFDGESPMRGAEVIRRVRETWLRAGHPAARATFERAYRRVNHAMMQQILGWCAHGTVVDPSDEFFVRALRGGEERDEDGEEDARRGAGREDDDGSGVWHESHRVALERIPPGVELSTAEAISFIGRGVRVLTHPTKSASMRGHFDAEAYAARATRRVRALAAAPAFDPRAFEAEVEVMRAEIAEALGEVLLRESGLVSHLAAMRDFYLLGKGDLYATFLDEARDLLALPPKPGSATRELSTHFTQAMAIAYPDEGESQSSFRLVYASALTRSGRETTTSATPSSAFMPRAHIPEYDAWDGIGLECAIEWPMGIFLTKDTIDRYKTMFKYALRLRRAQFDLQDAWIRLRRSGLSQTLRLRHAMNQLIENWRTYIHVDVIETEYKKMVETIGETTDFNACALAHRQYLASVVAHSFIDVGSIMTIFEDIFALVRELCETSAEYTRGQGLPADWDDRVDYLTRQFEKNSVELFDTLRGGYVVELPSLRALIARFNFNDFFEDASVKDVSTMQMKFNDLDV